MEHLSERCIILKQKLHCNVVLHYTICVSVFLLISLTVPPTKEMAVHKFVSFIHVPLTCNYMNIKTKLLEGKRKIYF